MNDARLTPANARVVLRDLADDHPGLEAVGGVLHAIAAPLAGLHRQPGGALDRQVVMGEPLRVLETRDGWSFAQLWRDGYVGYVETSALGPAVEATHAVATRASHLYSRPDIKAPATVGVSFGTRLRVVGEAAAFFETDAGHFVPRQHLRRLDTPAGDFVSVAETLLGTPYLWGGNSAWGIDCSGLVQAALLAADLPCPGDSDMQEASLGTPLAEGVPTERGDLFFWKGHVAIARDVRTLIHANAHHMAVACEPLAAAIARIATQGGGRVTSRRRLQGLGASS